MIEAAADRTRLLRAFPFLAGAQPGFREVFFRAANLVFLPEGEVLGRQGDACAHLALVVEGSARVYRLGESGREITLYRVRRGESCVLTASCILRHGGFPAFAQCECSVEAAVVGEEQVARWLREHQAWRDFVFGLVSERLSEVIGLLDAVVFERLDRRLARRLLAMGREADGEAARERDGGDADSGPPEGRDLAVTHQSLAAELGSSREVVSRLLGSLEERGIVATRRGYIRILRPDELGAIGRGA